MDLRILVYCSMPHTFNLPIEGDYIFLTNYRSFSYVNYKSGGAIGMFDTLRIRTHGLYVNDSDIDEIFELFQHYFIEVFRW